MNKTKIEYCDSTWNPVTGCLHECEYCYARRIARRFEGFEPRCGGEAIPGEKKIYGKNSIWNTTHDEKLHVFDSQPMKRSKTGWSMVKAPYPYGFDPTFHRYRLNEYADKSGRTIFVGSMCDLFGECIPDEWIEEVFRACKAAPQHTYLFLTINPKRYVELAKKRKLPDKHWYGYTATKESELWQVKHADEIPIKNLFVSIEPMHGEITIPFSTHCPADWVILGGETGTRKDKVIPKLEWIKKIVDDCAYSGRPLFMKNNLSDIWGEPLIQQTPFGKNKL